MWKESTFHNCGMWKERLYSNSSPGGADLIVHPRLGLGVRDLGRCYLSRLFVSEVAGLLDLLHELRHVLFGHFPTFEVFQFLALTDISILKALYLGEIFKFYNFSQTDIP